jgi:hypothetical protein
MTTNGPRANKERERSRLVGPKIQFELTEGERTRSLEGEGVMAEKTGWLWKQGHVRKVASLPPLP